MGLKVEAGSWTPAKHLIRLVFPPEKICFCFTSPGKKEMDRSLGEISIFLKVQLFVFFEVCCIQYMAV